MSDGWNILVVDEESDVLAVTRTALELLRVYGHRLTIPFAIKLP